MFERIGLILWDISDSVLKKDHYNQIVNFSNIHKIHWKNSLILLCRYVKMTELEECIFYFVCVILQMRVKGYETGYKSVWYMGKERENNEGYK